MHVLELLQEPNVITVFLLLLLLILNWLLVLKGGFHSDSIDTNFGTLKKYIYFTEQFLKRKCKEHLYHLKIKK